ncbi:uncharacterized protein PRCAT00005513001 [Priceomyces carsonii]|uniref:uncharacterized protein n=1 Tax=Priceomyces carsonii TaxID=28549 RepID=UPI002EDA9C68|nr:unnamed protein product [Priceomyces carsonii]
MSESKTPESKAKVPETKTNTSSKAGLDKEKLATAVRSLQFAWFVGHVVTLLSIFFYLLTYVKLGKYPRFWYQLALIGIVESFGILIYQLSKKTTSFGTLIRDDNVQYFFLGVGLLVTRPYVLLTLLPFALFSVFHVLAYTKAYLLPVARLDEHPISTKVGDFISKNNVKSVQLAAVLENFTLVWLFLRIVTFRKRSLLPFILYALFVKVRFEKSSFTRNHIKSIEVFIDNTVNKSDVPAIKQTWITAKGVFRRIGSFHLVNDYTKEKLT